MKTLHGIIGLLLAAAAAQTAQAARIYTCERNGETVYTSNPGGDCRSADLPSIGKYSSARYDAPPPPPVIRADNGSETAARPTRKKQNTARAAVPKAAPVKAAYVPAPTAAASVPKPANNSRRSILEQELANERKALNTAQKSLSEARTAKGGTINQQQINSLQSSVLDHQLSIQALQRELGRM
ncbi:hypothetical protein [Neisseria sp.]|uniref:hypothetical protein n=1 Tax=Neisseria sp. TaxID=192066 RepID=UPI0035A0E15D